MEGRSSKVRASRNSPTRCTLSGPSRKPTAHEVEVVFTWRPRGPSEDRRWCVTTWGFAVTTKYLKPHRARARGWSGIAFLDSPSSCVVLRKFYPPSLSLSLFTKLSRLFDKSRHIRRGAIDPFRELSSRRAKTEIIRGMGEITVIYNQRGHRNYGLRSRESHRDTRHGSVGVLTERTMTRRRWCPGADFLLTGRASERARARARHRSSESRG